MQINSEGQQSDSLKSGLRTAITRGADRVLITLADMPFISGETLNCLLSSKFPICACSVNGKRHQVPAIFSNALFDQLLYLNGDEGARSLFEENQTIGSVRVEHRCLMEVDTQDDLLVLEREIDQYS